MEDGDNDLEGRVEVCNDLGIWGTVCDDRFGAPEARVICRQLGYSDQGESKQVMSMIYPTKHILVDL